jgi:hypothetical protein
MLLAGMVLAAAGFPARAALPPGGTFFDDDRGYAEPSVEAVAAAGITRGCAPGRYCPNRPVTRAETAALLVRSLGKVPLAAASGRFPDVPVDAWFAPFVETAADLGIVVGDAGGRFRPADPLTRAEMAAVLVRAFPALEPPGRAPGAFADVDPAAWYAPAVAELAGRGLTVGCSREPLRYCPDEPVSRGQMAVFLARALGLTLQTPPDRPAPLDGRSIDGPAMARRVVAVKIDNARGGRPQSGVEQAEAVFEVLVEGGLTRWTGLFHRSDAAFVGPVRSARPTDTGLLLPLGATVAVSGAQPWILDQMAAAGVPILRERDVAPPAMFRIAARVAPHNLYADTAALRAAADAAGLPDEPPPPLFVWGDFASWSAPAVTTIEMSWSDPVAVTWTWDGSRYLRSMLGAPHLWVEGLGTDAAVTGRVSAETLVVIVAPVSEVAPPPGVSGSPVPRLDTVGSGPLLVFTRGRMVRGTWQRDSHGDWFDFRAEDGTPLVVPPGTPWINVFPAGRPIRVG